MNFNKTMCLTEYRDVRDYCGCYHRNKVFFPRDILTVVRFDNDECAKQIIDWMLIGKRFSHIEALRYFWLTEDCIPDLCS